uniref:Bm381 n=1 Tax=Brugia malayi TaxID=6279 RepID=A0A1I9G169_BRUMA|nr:Bm381 [Brugia malayi]
MKKMSSVWSIRNDGSDRNHRYDNEEQTARINTDGEERKRGTVQNRSNTNAMRNE